ncbi:MAG: hypothetical protein AAF388_17925 [Bacteroidota bacterium]
MSQKSSFKSTFLGLGSSTLSMALVCGKGACLAFCGAIYLAPLAGFLGISTAGLTGWMDELLPLFVAISAVAFTVSYYSLYKQPAENCCEENPSSAKASLFPLVWNKRLFWIGLMLTIGMYGYTYTGNPFQPETSTTVGKSSCSTTALETAEESCQPSSCSVAK